MVKARVGSLLALVVFLVVAGGVRSAHAQAGAPPVDAGLQPNRDYLALLPFETIDTGSGNVILTFTDLALPANGGRQLRFERVFSNVVLQDPSGPQWRFGIAGVPMKVVERPRSTSVPGGGIDAERLTTPYFEMLDGSRMETTYVEALSLFVGQKVQTVGFWRYDRATRVLRIPDGTVAKYDVAGRLVSIADAFSHGGEGMVTLSWSPAQILVSQSLGNGQTRQVAIELDEDTGSVVRLTYLDRTWTYVYAGTQLAEVRPPAGGHWSYRYSAEPFSTGKIAGVTTPFGGDVEYVYEDREFLLPGVPNPLPINVLAARRASDRGHPAGEWTFDYDAASDLAFKRTTVTTPSGTAITYVYGGFQPQEIVLAGHWMLRFKYIQAPDGRTLETHEWDYSLLKAARREGRTAVPWGVPRVVRHRVIRAGQRYDTEYEYAADGAEHPFHDFHRPITVTERGPAGVVVRQTRLTWVHLCHAPACNGPLLLGLPSTDETTVAGRTVRNERTYNPSTGFRESDTRSGIPTTFTPDAFGNLATATQANGTATSFTYSWGALQDIETAGVVVSREINPDGTLASETIGGRTTTFSNYDGLMRPGRMSPPGPVNPILTTFDDRDATVTSRRGSSFVTTAFDGFGRAVGSVNAAGVRTRTAYDELGRRIYQSYPFEGSADIGTAWTFDALGRVATESNPDGTQRVWSYDDAWNTATMVDETGHATVFGYRSFGHPDDARLVSVTDAKGQTWTYDYDVSGNLARVVTPTGETRSWVRDARGLLTSESHPESGTTVYTDYDAAGLLKRKVDARGTEFTYVHDGNGRVIETVAGGRSTEIRYETGTDNQLSVRNDDVVTTFVYDGAGRVRQRQDTVGAYVFVSRFDYDANDRLVSTTYPSGRVVGYDRQSDPEGRIARVFETASGRTYASAMDYHPSGALRAYVSGNLVPTLVEHDPLRYWVTGITSGPLRLTYSGYDGAGNVGIVGDARPGMRQSFTYDALHRLSTAEGPYGYGAFAYDAHGNQTGAYGLAHSYEPGTLRLLNRAGVSYAYDRTGNVVSAGGSVFSYTPYSLLASSTVNGTTTTYVYDGEGQRARKDTSGDTTIYLRGLSGEVLTEWRRSGSSTRTRDLIYAGPTLIGTVERQAAAEPSMCGGVSALAGAPVSIAIASGQTGEVTFEGSACRRVSVRVDATAGSFGCRWLVEIRRPNGLPLAGGSLTGCNAQTLFIEPVTLPVSGVYTVVVDPAGTSAGTAIVRVWDVVDIAGAIVPEGPLVTVPITIPGQVARYTFDGAAGEVVSVKMNLPVAMQCSWSLRILRPDGSILGSATHCLDTVAFIEPRTLPVTGRYTVVVDPNAYYVSTASLAVRSVVHVEEPIDTSGAPKTLSIAVPGQTGRYAFEGTAGMRISLRLDATWNMVCTWRLMLFGPDGVRLGLATFCNERVAFLEPRTLPAAGTYTVVVDPDAYYTGTVTVRAFEVNDMTAPIVPGGAPLPVTIAVPGQSARLTFSASAGEVRGVTMTFPVSVGCIWAVSLLKPDGGTLAAAPACNGTTAAIAPRALPVSGTYTVLLDPQAYYGGAVSVVVK